MSSKNEPRLTKAQRTSEAREQAKKIREVQLKKEKQRNWIIRGSVLLAAIVIAVVIALIMVQNAKNNEPVADAGPVPANANQYGGVTLGKGAAVIPPAVAGTTVDKNDTPLPSAEPTVVADPAKIGLVPSAAGKPVEVVVYLDFMCPACKNFETAFSAGLDELREAGKITVENRALPYLDRFSSGTNFSSRSAAAVACVVNESPESYKKFIDSLYANQPAENTPGLDNAKLKQLAKEAGAKPIDSCLDGKTYRPYVQYAGMLASANGINATPSAFVEGKQWDAKKDGDFIAFINKAVAAKK